ncbi:MAG: retention module-containing protein, partial [Halioglobus sp.]
MANSAIATVVAITGVAYARNADGEQRVLKPGDVLLEGETVVTPDGGRVELSLMDGAPLVVDDLPEMKLTADLIAERASNREQSAVEDETIDQVLAALEEGGDLNDLLEATAAGGAGGGADGAGHSFIRLGRIVEGTSEFSGIAGSGDRAAAAVVEQDLELPTVDAIDDKTRTDQGEPVTISVEDNDLFEDGYTIVDFTDPGNGSVVLNPDGTITYTPDDGFSGTDSFTYTASSTAGDEDTAVVTIVVDPPEVILPPEIFITIDDVDVTEGDVATLTISLSEASETAVSVRYASLDDTATVEGGDYDPATQTITFAPGTTEIKVSYQTNVDNIQEGAEDFLVNLSDATGATIADPQGVVTILDDYVLPEISIDDVTVLEGAQAMLTVSLSRAVEVPVTVTFETEDDTAVAAVVGGDYDAATGILTIDANTTEVEVTFQTKVDDLQEGTERFLVNLTNPENATIADDQGVVTIIDNFTNPSIASVSVNDVTVNEDAGTLTFTITKTGATTLAGSVSYTISPDSATTPADYTANDAFVGSVNFAANETSKTVTVNITDDNIDELTETFNINLSAAANLNIADGAGVGTILDNDGVPVLSVNDMTVNEEDGTLTFTVTKTGATTQAVTVDYDITPDSATTPADYSADDALSGSLNFAANETSKTVTVAITDDLIDELDETFDIALSNVSATATIGDGEGVGTILDNDPAPTVSVDDVTVNEEDGTLTFTITKTGLTSQAGSVNYAITPDSATTPADYTANDAFVGTVDFAANETSKTVTVNIIDDLIDELTETFDINLSAPVNLTIDDGAGVGTILDNDRAPVLSVNDMTVNEDAGTLTFTVTK